MPESAAAHQADHRVALVTGGARGIGLRLSTVLAEDGFDVAVVGRDAGRAQEAAESLPGRARGFVADVSDPAQVERLVAEVEGELGSVDLLVNNAGVRDQRARPWTDPADFWRTMEVNVRGVVLVTSAVLPGMIEREHGRVILLGSGMGHRIETRYAAYSVSKTAAQRWIEHVAAALLDDHSPVAVVTASPGLVQTDMTETMWDDSDDLSWVSTEPIEQFVRRFAAGELDHLHGQFVSSAKHDYGAS